MNGHSAAAGLDMATPSHPGAFTPKMQQNGMMTPSLLTPGGSTPIGTPAMGLKTPAAAYIPMTPEQAVSTIELTNFCACENK